MRRRNGQRLNEPGTVLRNELRSKRCGLSAESRRNFDNAICQHLQRLVTTHGARSIACYWPFNGEPDILPLCKQLMTPEYLLALPVVSEESDNLMTFHAWRGDTTLSENRYGICEPLQTETVPVSSFDLLLMPLVGYDRCGNRIGMGAGYYDRHLETLRHAAAPLRVGIAYSLQEIDPIEKNRWDIPLHGIVNERGWFTFTE